MATGTIRRYLSALGDTMTGDLKTKSSNLTVDSATNAWGNASFYLNDKNGARMATVRALQFANGMGGIQLGGHNGSSENILRIMINSSGTRFVYVSEPAVWRSALSAIRAIKRNYQINNLTIAANSATTITTNHEPSSGAVGAVAIYAGSGNCVVTNLWAENNVYKATIKNLTSSAITINGTYLTYMEFAT